MPRFAAPLLAALFLALHLPFLPRSLEDVDSINFALGIRDFDVARHQPHPPGYPLFILAAKALNLLLGSEVAALSLLSVAAGAGAAFALLALFAALDRESNPAWFTWLASLAVLVSPLFWLTAARPLSDVAGLSASLGVQALCVTARTRRRLMVAALLGGLAMGVRSQVAWLTLPVLFLAAVRLDRAHRGRVLAVAVIAYGTGVLLWLAPVAALSGGLRPYWDALFNQGGEHVSGVVMLATTPSLRQLFTILQSTFLAPWGPWQGGVVVLTFAAAGALGVAVREPRVLVTLFFAFGFYLMFHLLFQEDLTTRYALPLVVPVAYLAIRGARLLPRTAAAVLVIGLVAFSAVVDDRAASGYSRMPAPVFRMLTDMTDPSSGRDPSDAVLALHRRGDFDLRRPLAWLGERAPRTLERLPAPAKHEWLEVVQYWNGGGRAPVWFVADPLRSDLALIGHGARPVRYRWGFEPLVLMGGVRPTELDWHIIEEPDWYLGEGWALTPETAGLAKEDGRGPGLAPIAGWIRRWPQTTVLMIGGRNLALEGGQSARLRLMLDVADPLRSDLALIGHGARPVRYRWGFEPLVLMGGVRPTELDWHIIEEPDWYLGEGWALTPETAGLAKEDGRGPGLAPIAGWIRRWPQTTVLMIGGRNLALEGGQSARLRLMLDDRLLDEWEVSPGFFLRFLTVPAAPGPGDYAAVTVGSDSRDVAIEQFDAQPTGRVMSGFGEGWHELEYNPSTGALWRWTSDRAVLRVRASGRAVAVTLRGEIEEASEATVTLRAGTTVIDRFDVGPSFGRTVLVPSARLQDVESLITIETSASFVPAERRWSWRSRDRRRLGLKLYECAVTPAS